MEFLLLILLAYILGSVPTAKLVSARYGVDIQKKGSGNVGFANVYRVVGAKPAYIVLFTDITKGLVPTYLASLYLSPYQTVVVGSAAIVGHVFPLWLRFRGGKGVATACGVLLVISPSVALICLSIYISTLAAFRVFPLASIVAAICLPIVGLAVRPDISGWLCVLSLFGVWTHRSNIRTYIRIRQGGAAT